MQQHQWQHQCFCFGRTVFCRYPCSQETSLAELLDNEDYLLKILSFLNADGLYECCRVCRSWRNACRKLQLRLFVSHNDALLTAIQECPSTEKLHLDLTIKHPHKESKLPSQSQESLYERLLFSFSMNTLDALMRLHRLRHLELMVQKVAMPVARIECSFRQLRQLESFSFTTIERTESELRVVAAVRQLTALTALLIEIPVSGWVIFDPMPELSHIQKLHVNRFCFLTNGRELLFPSLRHLRCITVRDRSCPPPVDSARYGDPIQVPLMALS